MKDFLEAVLGIGAGAVGCVLYLAFWGVCLVAAIWLGITILGWIFG